MMLQLAVMNNSVVCFSFCLKDQWEMLPVLIPDTCNADSTQTLHLLKVTFLLFGFTELHLHTTCPSVPIESCSCNINCKWNLNKCPLCVGHKLNSLTRFIYPNEKPFPQSTSQNDPSALQNV